MEKEEKVMILSCVKGMEQHLVKEDKSVGATTKVDSKEQYMRVCYYHSALCSCVLVGNATDSVEEVAT